MIPFGIIYFFGVIQNIFTLIFFLQFSLRCLVDLRRFFWFFAPIFVLGNRETARLIERSTLPVLQCGPNIGECSGRTIGRRRLVPGRADRQTVRPQSAEAEASDAATAAID